MSDEDQAKTILIESGIAGKSFKEACRLAGVNEMQADSGSIASLGAHTRITFVGGAVATGLILTDSAGLTDVEAAGKIHILGGETAAGLNTVGSIGMLMAAATQAATITATAHAYYYPMSKGAYLKALL